MSGHHHRTPTLLLDEMHHPGVAAELRKQGFDVIAVADTPSLRAATDAELFRWGATNNRWIVTENIKDFRRILIAAEESAELCARLIFTTPLAFPRSRRNLGPLITALSTWLTGGYKTATGNEDWLA